MDEKLGTVIIEGELIDLDTAPIEKLKEMKKKLDEREKYIRAEIDKILNS